MPATEPNVPYSQRPAAASYLDPTPGRHTTFASSASASGYAGASTAAASYPYAGDLSTRKTYLSKYIELSREL